MPQMTMTLADNLVTQVTFPEEPAWFQQRRLAAWQQIPSLALPVFQKIDYHRWPLLAFATDSVVNRTIPTEVQAMQDDYQFVSVGTTTIKVAAPSEAGVILCDLATALRNHPELIKKYLMQTGIQATEDRLTAVNAALMNTGVFLYVPANTTIKAPIQLLQVQDSRQASNFISHTLIVAGENSHFQVLQRLITVGKVANPAHVMVEVLAETGSQVKFAALDSLSSQTHAYINRRGTLADDARIDWALGVLNNGSTIADFDSDLRGRGSHAEVKAVAIATGKQVQGIDTRVTNYAPHSEGNILQRGVLLGQSTLVFNGIGQIIHGAHGAKAQQENRILMLSPNARGDANPILLIDENDVIAGHAASVGRVNQQQLYYLMSRGIPKPVAERLVIRGFLGAVLAELPAAQVREQMTALVERKLVNGQQTE